MGYPTKMLQWQLFVKRAWRTKVRNLPARVKGTYSVVCGGRRASWVTKYSNSKVQKSPKNNPVLISRLRPPPSPPPKKNKRLSTLNHSYTDHKWLTHAPPCSVWPRPHYPGFPLWLTPFAPKRPRVKKKKNHHVFLFPSPLHPNFQFIHLPLIPWSFGNTTTISGKGFSQIFRAQNIHFGIFIRANTTSSAKRCVWVPCRNCRDDAGWPGWNPPNPGCISSSIILISPAFLGMTSRATM